MVSAHRTPERMYDFAKGQLKAAGFQVIIAAAGGAAHLPGMTASMTDLPVLGVPIESKALEGGMDLLLSIVQMPGGIPRRHPGPSAAARGEERGIAGRLDPRSRRTHALATPAGGVQGAADRGRFPSA